MNVTANFIQSPSLVQKTMCQQSKFQILQQWPSPDLRFAPADETYRSTAKHNQQIHLIKLLFRLEIGFNCLRNITYE